MSVKPNEVPFKVMLAGKIGVGQEKNLVYPFFATPKIDGFRMYVRDGIAWSRSNKPIPNEHVQSLIKSCQGSLEGFDGELVVGDANDPDVYNKTTGALRRSSGEPDVHFWVFDRCDLPNATYTERYNKLKLACDPDHPFVHVLEHRLVSTAEDLNLYEERMLEQGYEGLILRNPDALYKQGRSTLKESGMLKLKRFLDAEAEIIGYEELMHNQNPATVNELGMTSRTTHKANLSGGQKLGALVCRTPEGVEFRIGTGFTDTQRCKYWHYREKLIGETVKYKYFPIGIKEAPRHPVFLGFREDWDMSS